MVAMRYYGNVSFCCWRCVYWACYRCILHLQQYSRRLNLFVNCFYIGGRGELSCKLTPLVLLLYSTLKDRNKQTNKQMLQAIQTFERYNPRRPMPQPMSNTVVFFDGARSSSKAWHNISAPCMVFQRFFTGESCNSKPATVSRRLGTPTANCVSPSLMLWLWIDTLFVIVQCTVTTVVPHILFVAICPLETVTGAVNMWHMAVSKLLLLLEINYILLGFRLSPCTEYSKFSLG